MPRPFFSESVWAVERQPLPLAARCGACGLYLKCNSPKMVVSGRGLKKILIIGEAPGEVEDRRGRPFVGPAGEYLRGALAGCGLDLEEDCWVTNAVICRPPQNKLPEKAVGHCRPNLIRTVQELNPEVIIPLGKAAVQSLLGWLWREDVGGIGRWDGWRIPCQSLNSWICPTWHPSFVMRRDPGGGLREMLFRKRLRAAGGLQGRPWEKVPDYPGAVRVELDPGAAARGVEAFLGSKLVAFDYETNMLKPDGEKARIVSCSVSDGETTIAYPWHGAAVRATRELLFSLVPKVAANMKFEERWTRKEFGRGVRNWRWDTMLAAHVLDNRPGIASIKFQAFVLLGQGPWDARVKPFLKAPGRGGNGANRVADVELSQLLRYNGLDSLLEMKVAELQAKEMGVQLASQ